MTTTLSIETISLQGSEASKAIRSLLKNKYPQTKFSVKYNSYAGGDNISVSYVFGQPLNEIEQLLKGYEMGSFNGMEDIYEFHKEDRIVETAHGQAKLDGGVKYVHVSKEWPEGVNMNDIAFDLSQKMDIPDKYEMCSYLRRAYNRFDFKTSEIDPASVSAFRKSMPPLTVCSIHEAIDFNFEVIKKAEKEPAKLEILSYSQYSIVVFGTDYSHVTMLKGEGGKFNRYLLHPETKKKTPGWIFRASQYETVRTLLKLPK